MFKIQKRKVKCKSCKKELYNTEAYQVIEGIKKSYYCTEEEYKDIQNEKEQYKTCVERIAEVMNIKFVPPVMLKKISELRQFYNYCVIERTFIEYKSTIQWALDNKEFNSEFVKAKYIISIVANNIAKIDKKIKQEKKELEKLFSKCNNVEVEIIDIANDRNIENKEVSDISMFLD